MIAAHLRLSITVLDHFLTDFFLPHSLMLMSAFAFFRLRYQDVEASRGGESWGRLTDGGYR